MMLLCFAVGVLVQLYLQSAPGNFAVISAAAALLVLSCDWLFFYRMPGYSGSAQRYLWFVLPSAALTIPASLVEFASCGTFTTSSRSTTAWSDRRRNYG